MAFNLIIPTINDEEQDFDCLFQLWQRVNIICTKGTYSKVIFDFSKCKFLRQNAVAFIGGLARCIEDHNIELILDEKTLQCKIKENLNKNGFLKFFGNCRDCHQGNSIPYREDQEENKDKDAIVSYLSEEWLGKGHIAVSQELQNAIVSTTWEIYANAFEHSQTNVGVFSCGQYYPHLRKLKLTVVDFGVGIPYNVRNFLDQNDLPADKALKWAFKIGHTTRQGKITGGVGLDSLKSFVKNNQGKLEIFSHEGYIIVDGCKEMCINRKTFFQGTLVNITLQANQSYYSLESLGLSESESDSEPLF